MLGYLRADNPGVLETPPDGWYDTGDIVKIDDDGFITILGRAKRFAKIAGEMISLALVETKLAQALPEAQHAVVSVPDAQEGRAAGDVHHRRDDRCAQSGRGAESLSPRRR